MPFKQHPLTADRRSWISFCDGGAAALPYTAELTPEAVAMCSFLLKGRASLLVLVRRSMACSCLGCLSADRMRPPAT
eukprot:12094532-Heterocapsa_arctica.AAC.1